MSKLKLHKFHISIGCRAIRAAWSILDQEGLRLVKDLSKGKTKNKEYTDLHSFWMWYVFDQWHEFEEHFSILDRLGIVVTDESGKEVYRSDKKPDYTFEYADTLPKATMLFRNSVFKPVVYAGDFEAYEFDPSKLSLGFNRVVEDVIDTIQGNDGWNEDIGVVLYGDNEIDMEQTECGEEQYYQTFVISYDPNEGATLLASQR